MLDCYLTISPHINPLSLWLQKEEERLRASIRRESQQRRVREKAHQRGLSGNYLEGDYDDDDEEGGVSIKALKEKYKGGAKRKYACSNSPAYSHLLDL
jgi:hypothetical protein